MVVVVCVCVLVCFKEKKRVCVLFVMCCDVGWLVVVVCACLFVLVCVVVAYGVCDLIVSVLSGVV